MGNVCGACKDGEKEEDLNYIKDVKKPGKGFIVNAAEPDIDIDLQDPEVALAATKV